MNFFKKIILLSIILASSCKANKTSQGIPEAKLKSKIESKLGPAAVNINNFDNSLVLGYREDNSSGTIVIRFGVWEVSSGKLVYADTAMRGSVQWLDNTSLLVEDYPGMRDESVQNYKFKIDLNTKIKTPLNVKKDK